MEPSSESLPWGCWQGRSESIGGGVWKESSLVAWLEGGGGCRGGDRFEHRRLGKAWKTESHVFALKENQRFLDAESQDGLWVSVQWVFDSSPKGCLSQWLSIILYSGATLAPFCPRSPLSLRTDSVLLHLEDGVGAGTLPWSGNTSGNQGHCAQGSRQRWLCLA